MTAIPLGEDALEAEVLAYLAEHPHAMDTLAGIADWWLERRRISVEVTVLWRALDRLVQQGALERFGSGEGALYRLTRARTDSSTPSGDA